MAITETPVEERMLLREHQRNFDTHVSSAGCCIGSGELLLFPSLIVAFCGGLAIALPGVNVLNDVVLKAFLPATTGICLSVLFFVSSIKPNEEKKKAREAWLLCLKKQIDNYFSPKTRIDEKGQNKALKKGYNKALQEEAGKFIESLLPSGKAVSLLYRQGLINDQKKFCEGEQEPQKTITGALNEALKLIYNPKTPKAEVKEGPVIEMVTLKCYAPQLQNHTSSTHPFFLKIDRV